MVIDTSAILAVLQNEEDRPMFESRFALGCRKFLCPFNALEADIVITSRYGSEGKRYLESFLFHCGIEILPFTRGMYELAYEAWLKFGKSRHKAKLNMGDCCAYAVAKALNEPLLYKGGDFSLTDIKPAV
mgnify:CR=1 FL=1